MGLSEAQVGTCPELAVPAVAKSEAETETSLDLPTAVRITTVSNGLASGATSVDIARWTLATLESRLSSSCSTALMQT